MANREDMILQLTQLQQEFARLVRNIDQDELGFAATSARAIADRIRGILNEVQAGFAQDFSNHRLRMTPEDQQAIDRFSETPPTRQDVAELARIAAHFSRDIRAIDRLVALVYPRPPFSFKPLIDRYGKRTAIIGGSLLALFLIISGYDNYRSKRIGLLGRYHASISFNKVERTRNDKQVNFRWGRGTPIRGWRRDGFSVRWTGYLHVPFPEKWEIQTTADDGVRLFIGDRLLIEDWKVHPVTRHTVELRLSEGYYPITLEYFDKGGGASVSLLWREPGNSRVKPIPSGNLVPSAQYLKKDIPVIETLPSTDIISGSAFPLTPEEVDQQQGAPRRK